MIEDIPIQTTTPIGNTDPAPPEFIKRMKEGGSKVTTTTTTSQGAPTTTTDATTAPTTAATTVGTKEPPKPARKKPRVATGYEHLPVKETKPAITKEDLAEVGKAAGKALGEELARKEEAKAEDNLNDEEKYHLEVYGVLERREPEKYKGLVAKTREFLTKFNDFAGKWMEDHPDEEFDANGKDADEFRAANQPRVSDIDFDRAKVRLEVEPLERENTELKQRLDQSARQQTRQQIDREAVTEAIARGKDVAARLDPKLAPELIKVIKPDGSFDKAEVDRLIAEGDVTTEIYLDAIGQAENVAHACVQLFSGVPVEQIALAPAIIKQCQNLDAEIAALAPQDQLDEANRPFAPYPVYVKMKPAEKAKHWTLTADVVATIAAAEIAKGAKARAEKESIRVEAIAKKRGYIKPAAQAAAPEEVVTKKSPSPASTASGAPDRAGAAPPSANDFFSRMKSGVRAPMIR